MNENGRKTTILRKIAGLGKIFIFAAVIVAVIGLMYWRADRDVEQTKEQVAKEQQAKKRAGETSAQSEPSNLAILDSWYKEDKMLPSEQLGNDPNWQIIVNGEISEDGLDDSVLLERNLTDSTLAKALSAHLFVDATDGAKELEYQKDPVVLKAGKSYTVEFDCSKYNLLEPIDGDTMRYYIVPARLKKDESGALTFAVHEASERVFHQICIPFRVDQDVEIYYSLDDTFEEETLGQVHRLYIQVEESQGE